MAKKKFGISPSVNQALTQTIQMAESEDSNFFNTEILIDRIILDSDNPRKQKITIADVKQGISSSDKDHEKKKEEYESLSELSESIKRDGLLNPISVVEEQGNFKVVAGERRFLATVLAKKTVIEARVFKKKPKPLDLKVIQWSENHARKDLSLFDKLMNIVSIVDHYKLEHQEEMTAIKLAEIIGMSRQQAQYYKSIISNSDLMNFIKDGKVSTFDAARKLAPVSIDQMHLKMNEIVNHSDAVEPVVVHKDKSLSAGRKRVSVNFGKTSQPLVAKAIVETVLSSDQFKSHSKKFSSIDWACLDQSTKAFQKLVEILEKEVGVAV